MKTDLFTAIIAAVVGVLIAFFATNALMGPIESVTFQTLEDEVNANLADPDPEIFNYRALNPTVEVYVGDCDEYNDFGECVEPDDESVINVEQQGE